MKNRLYIHVTSWIFYLSLAVYYKSNVLGIDYAFKHTMVTGALSIAMFYTYSFLVINRFFEQRKYILFAIFSLVVLAFFFALRMRFEVPNFPEFYELLKYNDEVRIRRTVFGILLLSMVMIFIITALENRIRAEKKAMALLSKSKEAQLSYLKAQINPHFLFNSLNNIYSLAVAKSDNTPKMVLHLSDLLRYSIYEGRKEKVLVSDEIKQIKNYIRLFRLSKEDQLNITFTVEGAYQDMHIEPMILIPLAENCLKHSDIELNEKGYIRMSLRVTDDMLVFHTDNSKNDMLAQKDAMGGVGLENIRKRLQLRYPNRHHFKIEDEKLSFKVELELNKKGNS